MRNESEINGLLDEVFEDVAPSSFRAELFGQTLKEARRRNRARRRNQAVLTLAAVALAGLLVWRREAPRIVPQRSSPSSLAVVRSAPLDPSEVVETIPGSAHLIGSSSSTIASVETQSSVPELNDAELLALMDGTPSVLVRKGPHEEELLVVDATTSTPRPVDDTYQRDMPNP
jgi:hypothetical protein